MKSSHFAQKKEDLIESLCLPKDICLGDVKITLFGCHEATIENYKGIIEYNDSFIMLQGKKNQVLIEGSQLKINYYTNEDMKITGVIVQIKYL